MKRSTFIAIACLMFTGTAAARTSLYQALLTSSFQPVPAGFYNAQVGADALDARDKAHHAVGRVIVTFGSDAAVQYGVFPGWTQAAARFSDKLVVPHGTTVHLVGRVPGYRKPSRWLNGTITGKNAFGKTVTNGLTQMCVRSSEVIVCSVTISTDSDASGDIPAALRLLKAGLGHLQVVRAR